MLAVAPLRAAGPAGSPAVSSAGAANPAAATASPLQSYARAVIESKSVTDRRKLEQFAEQNAPAAKAPAQAALAQLALGYFHLQIGRAHV